MYKYRNELLESYSHIFDVCKSLDNCQINMITPMCKRSLAQLIYHIVFYENIYVSTVFRKLVFGQELNIKSFVDYDLSEISYTINELEAWIEFWKHERARNIALLDKFYVAMLEHKLIHEVHGELGIDDILEKMFVHDKHHTSQFEAILIGLKGRTNAIHN